MTDVAKSDFRGQWAAEVDPTPPEVFWHDRFEFEGINVIAGPSGVMKSTLVAKIIADFSRTVGPVISSNLEDNPALQRLRLEAAGADMDKVRLVPDAPYRVPDDLKQLESDILRGGFKLVVMDTAAKHIDAPIFKSTDKTARVLVPLTQLAHRTGACILLVEHTLKHTKGFSDPLAAVPDGLARTCRVAALFGYDPQDADRRAMAWVKFSSREKPIGMALTIEVENLDDEADPEDDPEGIVPRGIATLHIDDAKYDIADPLSLVRVHVGKGEGESAHKRAAAATWLTEALANGPIPVNDCELCPQHGHVRADAGQCPVDNCTATALTGVAGLTARAEADGIAWRTVRRAKDAIGCEIITKTKTAKGESLGRKGKVAAWRLPKGHPKLSKKSATELT